MSQVQSQAEVAEATGATERRQRIPLLVLSVCAALVAGMVASINIAVPKISAGSLHPSSVELLWVVDSYVIVFACLLIPAGAFADRYGRKGALLSGLGLFVLGCLLCAWSPSIGVLLTGRVVTGLGAALVMPASLSTVVAISSPEAKARAIATWSLAVGVAGVPVNVLGGLILDYLPWQALFLVFAPLAAGLGLWAAGVVPRVSRGDAAVDPLGSVLIIVASCALLYGIIEGPVLGWAALPVVGSFVVAVVVATAFVAVSRRKSRPILDPRVFRSPKLRAGTLGVTAVFFALFGLFYFSPQYLQFVKGLSVFEAGVAVVPMGLVVMVTTRRAVGLAERFGSRRILTLALALIVFGMALLSLLSSETPIPLFLADMVVIAAGMGLCTPMLSTAIITGLPADQAGVGSGLNSATREIGSALGVAVLGTIVNSQFGTRLPASLAGHASSVSDALAAGRRTGRTHEVLAAFSGSASIAFLVVSAVLLVVSLLVIKWFRED